MRAQRAMAVVAVAVMVAAGCSGRADERAASDDGAATTEPNASTDGSGAPVERDGSAETEAGDAAIEALADPRAAVTEAGFECADAPGRGGAARATCTADGDIAVELYAWENAEDSTEHYADTVRCPEGGPLSNLTAVRGPAWVMALVPAEDAGGDIQGAIDVLSVQLQEATGQPVTIQPCATPED